MRARPEGRSQVNPTLHSLRPFFATAPFHHKHEILPFLTAARSTACAQPATCCAPLAAPRSRGLCIRVCTGHFISHVCRSGHHITSDQITPLCTDHIKPLYKVSTTSARARPGLAHALHPAGTCVTPISLLCPEPTATHTLKCLAKRVARALVTLRRRARRCLLSCLLSWP